MASSKSMACTLVRQLLAGRSRRFPTCASHRVGRLDSRLPGPLIDGCSRALFSLKVETTKIPLITYLHVRIHPRRVQLGARLPR